MAITHRSTAEQATLAPPEPWTDADRRSPDPPDITAVTHRSPSHLPSTCARPSPTHACRHGGPPRSAAQPPSLQLPMPRGAGLDEAHLWRRQTDRNHSTHSVRAAPALLAVLHEDHLPGIAHGEARIESEPTGQPAEELAFRRRVAVAVADLYACDA